MAKEVTKRPIIAPFYLEGICKVIADTTSGLTGTEIGKILADCGIKDVDPLITKWKRLYNAFVEIQNRQKCSNAVLNFLHQAMHPSRYIGKNAIFQSRRHDLNKQLSFIGTEITERGTFREVEKTTTISEAEERASHFKYKLTNRIVHEEIFKYCNSELLVENYFHSVFEAVKSVADRIRNMTGYQADGNVLIDAVFSTSNPQIRINQLRNDTERSEHLGLANMIKGLFGIIRNPTAHEPKIKFVIEEEEALDLMTTVSYIHKRLDKAL
ncbi:MAG TPA: TIGR02391 family protein [Chitinophagaceae bacterium]|nr:TIGR02391 family protein [Chitinophagaceae bacterium]